MFSSILHCPNIFLFSLFILKEKRGILIHPYIHFLLENELFKTYIIHLLSGHRCWFQSSDENIGVKGQRK